MSVKKKQLSVDEMEKVTGGARTFESVPNPDGSGWLKVYVNGRKLIESFLILEIFSLPRN